MRRELCVALSVLMAGGCAVARDFNEVFADSTLRVDCILGGNAASTAISFSRAFKGEGWAGRRVNLGSLPYQGNGQITVIDEAKGDTLYRNSFSTLYQEWLTTPEAATLPKAMEHTVLAPLPKRPAIVSVSLLDSRHAPIARMDWRYSPDDVLVGHLRGEESALPVVKLHTGGDSDKAIDVAILAEGYTAEEADSFYTHARRAVDAILRHEPFKSRAADFNFVAVGSFGNDTGVSVPRFGDWRSTPFSSHFSTFYSDRYLTTDRVNALHDALAGVPYEHIIVLANTDEYGGGGIFNSYTLTAARNRWFEPVVVHEFGHSFGGLADEYFYPDDVMSDTYPTDIEPWEPNITTLVDFGSKWKSLLAGDTPVPTPVVAGKTPEVGVFEGGGYAFKGVYRPADQCRMRTNQWPSFCPACIASMNSLIDFYTRPASK